MDSWKAQLRADPTEWLLDDENPSVRYFTLKDLLDKPEDTPEVNDARQEIMRCGMVPQILELQRSPEYLAAFPRFYTNKYKGLVWQLITLAELGALRNAQIETQCEYILTNSLEKQDGGFAMGTAAKTGGGRISEVIPCLTGNMVWSLIRFGYLEDPRLQRAIDWLTRFMRFNDGMENDPQVPPYNHYEMCWGKHTCHMGVVKALKAFEAIPSVKRSNTVNKTLAEAAEFMLLHRIHKQSHNPDRTSKPGWLKFGFPLMYQTDALEILDILTGLGIRDNRMGEAIDVMISKQDNTGRWHIENTYANDRLLVPFSGEKDGESKWLTLRALRVLKRYHTNNS
jgi:hypothetical protein